MLNNVNKVILCHFDFFRFIILSICQICRNFASPRKRIAAGNYSLTVMQTDFQKLLEAYDAYLLLERGAGENSRDAYGVLLYTSRAHEPHAQIGCPLIV